jgi:hypothetical protein
MTSINPNYGTWRSQVIQAAIAAFCAVVLIVASLIAERWCELPPSPTAKAKEVIASAKEARLSTCNRHLA